jgi:hypothetical protein
MLVTHSLSLSFTPFLSNTKHSLEKMLIVFENEKNHIIISFIVNILNKVYYIDTMQIL